MPSQRIPRAGLHRHTNQLRVRYRGRDLYFGRFDNPASHAKYEKWKEETFGKPPAGANAPALAPASSAGHPTVNAILLAFWQYAELYYQREGKPGPEFDGTKAAARPVKQLFGSRPATQFGPLALREVRQRMVDEGRLCRNEVNRRVHRIRRMFRWAVSMELIPSSVYEALRTVEPLIRGRTTARETNPVLPVKLEDVDNTLPFVTPQVAAMIQLQKLTGLRPGEVVRMRLCDIDRKEETWIYRPLEHKTAYRGKVRHVPLGSQARKTVEPFLDRNPEAYLFSPVESEKWRNEQRAVNRNPSRTTKVYPSELRTRKRRIAAARSRKAKRPKRDRFDTNSYAGAVSNGVKRANRSGTPVPHWHPNQLRHTYATIVREKFGLDAAQTLLGHSQADVTQVYAEVNLKAAVRIAEQFG